MTDIVERLRSLRHIHVPQLSDEAADEIERLRQVLERKNLSDAERCAITEASEFYIGTRTGVTLSRLLSRTGSDDAKTCDDEAECHANGEKLPERERLTDDEREAVVEASDFYVGTRTGLALSGLLKRLGGDDV